MAPVNFCRPAAPVFNRRAGVQCSVLNSVQCSVFGGASATVFRAGCPGQRQHLAALLPQQAQLELAEGAEEAEAEKAGEAEEPEVVRRWDGLRSTESVLRARALSDSVLRARRAGVPG